MIVAVPVIPSFVPPMLATLVDEPPEGDDWTHEIKYDGYRTELAIGAGGGRAYTRRGHDWSDRYRRLLDAAAGLVRGRTALLDGEVIIQDAAGRSDFHGLRSAIQAASPALVFMAFDLLHFDGRDLRREPIEERRARLAEMIGDNDPDSPLQFSASITGGGPMFFAQGIVSKKAGSKYRSGDATTWLKTKTFAEGELVVVGTEYERGKPPIALLAWETEAGLEYAGGAMITLGGAERERFWEEAERLATSRPAVAVAKRRAAKWVLPEMRVRVRHLRGEEKMRHATLLGLA
jgi:bifunctional non-homologous end joining protein LigD